MAIGIKSCEKEEREKKMIGREGGRARDFCCRLSNRQPAARLLCVDHTE